MTGVYLHCFMIFFTAIFLCAGCIFLVVRIYGGVFHHLDSAQFFVCWLWAANISVADSSVLNKEPELPRKALIRCWLGIVATCFGMNSSGQKELSEITARTDRTRRERGVPGQEQWFSGFFSRLGQKQNPDAFTITGSQHHFFVI